VAEQKSADHSGKLLRFPAEREPDRSDDADMRMSPISTVIVDLAASLWESATDVSLAPLP
jgi:hypothetical protein